MKKVSLKDIAIAANVSPTTVSLVLNDRPSRISEAKKAEIKALAEKYNYVPNANAVGLAKQTTNTIGVIIPDIENPFFSGLASAIEKELRNHGYNIILINSDDKLDEDINAIRLLINRGVDGLILTLASESLIKQDEIVEMLDKSAIPYVQVDRVYWQKHINYVTYNDYEGQFALTDYVIKKGFRRIILLAPPAKSFHFKERVRGFKEAHLANKLEVDEAMIIPASYRYQGGYDITETVLSLKPDVILAANDIVAYGVIKRLTELNYKVPDDIAVTGYDDLAFSKMALVPLTTMRQDTKALGKHGVNLLMDQIKHEKEPKQIILSPVFIKRDSL